MSHTARWHRDWRLYLVADEIHFRKGWIEDAIVRAIRGGVQILQLREKHCSNSEFIELARRVLRAIEPYRVPVIINDRIEVAQAVRAQGVHLGQKDAHPDKARHILGESALIGLSVETEAHAQTAESLNIDYLGVSSVFATQTKSDVRRIWGLDGVRSLRRITPLPLVGIGGIGEDNLGNVIRSGADSVAIVSAFHTREDWKSKAERLSQRVTNARKQGDLWSRNA